MHGISISLLMIKYYVPKCYLHIRICIGKKTYSSYINTCIRDWATPSLIPSPQSRLRISLIVVWNETGPHLSDGPGSLGVHGGVGTPGVGELAGELLRQVCRVLGGVQGLDVDALQGEEES